MSSKVTQLVFPGFVEAPKYTQEELNRILSKSVRKLFKYGNDLQKENKKLMSMYLDMERIVLDMNDRLSRVS